MYLFISISCHFKKFRRNEACHDYLYDKSLSKLKKKVLKYADKYGYPINEPTGVFEFRKKFGAVIEKYTGDVIGWIIKL